MVNEAVLIFETHLPIPFSCSDTTGIEKGTLLTLSDPMTVAACTVSTAAVAGIAAEEIIASGGKNKIAVYRGGIFKVSASGAITVGEAVAFSDGTNGTVKAIVNHENIAGIALETVATGETYLMELRPSHYELA